MLTQPNDPLPTSDKLAFAEPERLHLQGCTYDDRRAMLEALSDAILCSGAWLHERQPLSPTVVELQIEVRLRSAVDLYTALMATGLELTGGSHGVLIQLCTLRSHVAEVPLGRPRVLSVSLEVTFLDEAEPGMSALAAQA